MKAVALILRMLRHKGLTTSWILLCIGSLLGGCITQATGDFFSPARHLGPDQTMIYLYFPRHPGYTYSHVIILANGTTVTRLDQGGYYPLRTAPGRITFSLAGEPEPQNLTIIGEPERAYFVKVLIRYETHRYYQLFLVNEELAMGEMGPLRLMTTCHTTQGCTPSLNK